MRERRPGPGGRPSFAVDGRRCTSLAAAAAEFTSALGFSTPWQGNLDALNDFLNGGFGTPDDGFVLVWRNSELARKGLGQAETLRWLEERLRDCHPSNAAHFRRQMEEVRQGRGEMLFDMIVSIIREHADIELRLE